VSIIVPTIGISRHGQKIFGLVDYATTLDLVSEDFVQRISLQTHKSKVTPFRLANGQRVTSSTLCEITFELARHEFKRILYVLSDKRACYVVLGLPCVDDEQSSILFDTTRIFTLMDGTTVKVQIEVGNLSVCDCRLARFRSSCSRRAEERDVPLNFTCFTSRQL
jgi:hypothetical protein